MLRFDLFQQIIDYFPIIVVFFIFVFWKLFEKTGKPGWAAIVPIYNMIVYLEIIKMPIWWLALILIPCVNFISIPIFWIISNMRLAKAFGKDTGFATGLVLLPVFFMPLLVFSKSKYQPENLNALDASPREQVAIKTPEIRTDDRERQDNDRDMVSNAADEILKLEDLWQKGIINFEEYESLKKKITES